MDFKKLFESYGFKVKAAQVISDPIKTRGHSYGYISFENEEELNRCLKEMNNVKVEGHELILNRQGDNFRNPAANIIIRNIPKNITQSDVH